jgi:tetratricopeptide (TPR) repeat protein
VGGAVTLALVVLAGCGGGGEGREVERAFKKGNYADAVALGRHALRTGEDSPRMHLYYGMSLVAVGRDHEGFREIDTAVRSDSAMAGPAADFLWAHAIDKPASDIAPRRMRKAHELSPSIDLGRYRFAVADVCFQERSYAKAASLYDQAVRAYPDTAACETAYANLAECWKALGDPARARQAMETLVARYPRSDLAIRASARLDDIALDEAQQAYDGGKYDRAVELAQDLASRSQNRSLQQKARFLLGESYEATGKVADAYAVYREIIRGDRGDSGRVVDQARARIEALQEAGLK